jgi:hypothetical protein
LEELQARLDEQKAKEKARLEMPPTDGPAGTDLIQEMMRSFDEIAAMIK